MVANCTTTVQGRADALGVHSRHRKKQSRIRADLLSGFSSSGLKATVRVSQIITDERASWQVCRDQTDSNVRVGVAIGIQA
jgi:hypothetical protein